MGLTSRVRTCGAASCTLSAPIGLSSSTSSCKNPGSRSLSPSSVASSSGSSSPYSSLHRPFFLLEDIEAAEAAAAWTGICMGIREPEREPDAREEAEADCCCCRFGWAESEGSRRAWVIRFLGLRSVCRRMSDIKRGAECGIKKGKVRLRCPPETILVCSSMACVE
jgi:hypothetical protein